MITHRIYEIPGVKIGCTQRTLKRRQSYYPKGTPDLVLVEELHDVTDQEAGDIEWAWAVKKGYKRGQHFTKTSESRTALGSWTTRTTEQNIEAGRKGGTRSVETTTPEQRAKNSRKGGLRAGELGRSGFHQLSPEQRVAAGKKRMATLTSEERSELARRAGRSSSGGQKTAELGVGIHGMTKEQRIALGRKTTPETGRKVGTIQAKCPHCGLKANLGNLRRWHFDNCRQRSSMT